MEALKAKQLGQTNTTEVSDGAKTSGNNSTDVSTTTNTITEKTEIKNTSSGTSNGSDTPKKTTQVAGKEKTTDEKQNPYQEVKAVAKPFTKEPENTSSVNLVGYVIQVKSGTVQVGKIITVNLYVYYNEDGVQKYYIIPSVQLDIVEKQNTGYRMIMATGREVKVGSHTHYFKNNFPMHIYNENIH